MSKIFGYYQDNIDKTWYDSSNVIYSECIDNVNDYKILKVIFKNGTCYEYSKVDVKDYLFFREAESQGKELNDSIKKKGYEYKKLQDENVDDIKEELDFRRRGGITVMKDSKSIKILSNTNKELLTKEVESDDKAKELALFSCDLINSLGLNARYQNID